MTREDQHMPTFQDGERAFEAKWAHDEDFRFRLIARRDKLFAHQAAEQLELPEQAASGRATAVLALRDGHGHDGLLIRYVADVFALHGRADVAEGLSASLDACNERAKQQVLAQPDSE